MRKATKKRKQDYCLILSFSQGINMLDILVKSC